MSKTRRKREKTSVPKEEVVKADIADNKASKEDAVNIPSAVENQISDSKVTKSDSTVSYEGLPVVVDLQSKYRELSDRVKSLDEKVAALGVAGAMINPTASQKVDNTNSILEVLRKDLSTFTLYGKLFFGVGVAALLLYLINGIINLVKLLRPA